MEYGSSRPLVPSPTRSAGEEVACNWSPRRKQGFELSPLPALSAHKVLPRPRFPSGLEKSGLLPRDIGPRVLRVQLHEILDQLLTLFIQGFGRHDLEDQI